MIQELLVIAVAALSALQCSAEDRVPPHTKPAIEQKASDLLSNMPGEITVLGMQWLSKNQPVPQEVCDAAAMKMGEPL